MKKVYYLSSCSTCQRILKELNISTDFDQQDIKADSISKAQLEEMKALSGSYESLFSRRAMKFRQQGLHEKQLSETDYRDLILEEYTFLKRPVFIVENKIFIGNSKKVVEKLAAELANET